MASKSESIIRIAWPLLLCTILLIATLVADCLYVMWPYPSLGEGLPGFQNHLNHEWEMLVRLNDARFPALAYSIYDRLHYVFFDLTGLDAMINRANDATPMTGGNEMMRRWVLSMGTLWGTALTGLKLFSARLAVLILSAPLILLAAICGIADGLVTWFQRRTGGGRESGFIYHRAKWHGMHALLILAFAYLVPPLTVDPRIAISICAVVFMIAMRIAAANFKKYL